MEGINQHGVVFASEIQVPEKTKMRLKNQTANGYN